MKCNNITSISSKDRDRQPIAYIAISYIIDHSCITFELGLYENNSYKLASQKLKCRATDSICMILHFSSFSKKIYRRHSFNVTTIVNARSSWLYYSLLFVLLFIAGYKNWLGPSKSEFGEPRKSSGKLVANYCFPQ